MRFSPSGCAFVFVLSGFNPFGLGVLWTYLPFWRSGCPAALVQTSLWDPPERLSSGYTKDVSSGTAPQNGWAGITDCGNECEAARQD